MLRAQEGSSPGALVEELLALRAGAAPRSSRRTSTARLVDCLDLALPAAVAAHAREQTATPRHATRDRLTGLLAPPVFHEALVHEVEAARRHGPPSLVVATLDGLVPWAERHGNMAGDLHVVRLVQVVRDSSRRSDVACRLSADTIGPAAAPHPARPRPRRRAARPRRAATAAACPAPAPTTGCPRLHVGLAFSAEPSSADALLAESRRVLREAVRLGGDQVAASRPLR